MNSDILKEACEHIDSQFLRAASLEKGVNEYNVVVTAAFAKVVDFNTRVNSSNFAESDSFFYMASLRGICEDLITLTYLYRKLEEEDRNRVIHALSNRTSVEHIQVQTEFFRSEKPSQPLIRLPAHHLDVLNREAETILKEIGAKTSWGRNREFPSVSHMATECGLIKLYRYMYHATSDLVHFSTHTLLRMGWGEAETGEFTFSAEKFSSYYIDFCRFYGAYLLVEFWKALKEVLVFKGNIKEQIKTIRSVFGESPRWPEIVSFEEMNKQPPDFGRAQLQGKLLAVLSNEERRKFVVAGLRARQMRRFKTMSREEKLDSLKILGGKSQQLLTSLDDQKLDTLLEEVNTVILEGVKRNMPIEDANEILLTLPVEDFVSIVENFIETEEKR